MQITNSINLEQTMKAQMTKQKQRNEKRDKLKKNVLL